MYHLWNSSTMRRLFLEEVLGRQWDGELFLVHEPRKDAAILNSKNITHKYQQSTELLACYPCYQLWWSGTPEKTNLRSGTSRRLACRLPGLPTKKKSGKRNHPKLERSSNKNWGQMLGHWAVKFLYLLNFELRGF